MVLLFFFLDFHLSQIRGWDDGLIFPPVTPIAPFSGLRMMPFTRLTLPLMQSRDAHIHTVKRFNAKISQPLPVIGKHGAILLVA